MQSRGYSLVEMVVCIGIISILLAIATVSFNRYLQRYQREAQTRMIFEELLATRANAVYQRRATRVKLYSNRFEVYSSSRDDTDGVAPMRTRSLRFPIISNNGGGDGVKGYPVTFDTFGITNNNCAICLDEAEGSGGVDSVVIYFTRISIGKKEKGDDCKAANVTIQ
ncbi:MAG TPA: prepilin-type N-terminal cleavage/methylation domain-containing protein [Geomonas sp.]|nr:prepilin-type N-terminal cleavage/methylation domain-containing protein [Geomonas sp.]